VSIETRRRGRSQFCCVVVVVVVVEVGVYGDVAVRASWWGCVCCSCGDVVVVER
jgi:hypothetical protein